ncbi:MAG: hypothetical protein U0Q12_04610 [Vicinamibacterales bacterium]
MRTFLTTPAKVLPVVFTLIVVGVVSYANWRDATRSRDASRSARSLPGRTTAVKTSRADLAARIGELESTLRANSADVGSAVLLGDALMRQARVTGNVGLTARAEEALKVALKVDPANYEAQRMLSTVYLSQHRFREALAMADRMTSIRAEDAWNYGVAGDAHIELGDYDQAFASFQKMMETKPSAPAYARASYALELQGDWRGALESMRLSLAATSPIDVEALAWHQAQIGDLLFAMGAVDEAARCYERGYVLFRDHPAIVAGLSKARAARGEYQSALDLNLALFARQPSPDIAGRIGDLHHVLGHEDEAERYYALAESGWRTDMPEPGYLAAFLAERNRNIDEAVALAETQASWRRDIFTMDALAWAYFRAGRLPEAVDASKQARRTGTKNRVILYHAAAIEEAAGDRRAARRLVDAALDGHPHFDLIVAPEAAALRARLDAASALARRS